MKEVGKYNLFKTLSILVTCVPTILVGLYFGEGIVKDPGQSISLAGVIGIIIAILFLKNKIAENFKVPSPFIIATVLFVIIILFEQILIPAKFTCLTIMIVCGIDELLFKRIYKRIEALFPHTKDAYKHFGYYFCKTDTLLNSKSEENTK